MIVYNMRYRGPLEYDKFALNVLQFHNDVFFRHSDEFNEMSVDENNLISTQKEVNNTLATVMETCDSLYLEIIKCKEML
jgi:uncharacterized protein YozE (UPF0346 family)